MITDSFDINSPAKINPCLDGYRIKCDAIVATFSYIIEDYVLSNFEHIEIGHLKSCTGFIPVWLIKYKGRHIAFFKTKVGAPACVGTLEDVIQIVDTDNVIIFGSAGTLNKNIEQGSYMVPTMAYRDEGTSYHYIRPSDYIEIKNHDKVSSFLEEKNVKHAIGGTWTTDAFFRETENNIIKRQKDGCISVEMECSAVQAWADFRNFNLYYMLVSGDLLDADEWDRRKLNDEDGANHKCDSIYLAFDMAIKFSSYIVDETSVNILTDIRKMRSGTKFTIKELFDKHIHKETLNEYYEPTLLKTSEIIINQFARYVVSNNISKKDTKTFYNCIFQRK